MQQTFTAAVPRQNDDIAESLKHQRFNNFTNQIGKGVGLHIDRSLKHSAAECIIEYRGGNAAQFLRQSFGAIFRIADVGIQRQMEAVLFAQSLGQDHRLIGFQILLQFTDGQILHTVVFHNVILLDCIGFIR